MNSIVGRCITTALMYIFTFVLVLPTSYANNFTAPYFTSFSLDDGLSQASVSDIAEDKYGYIWLATQAGIDRFDGYTFRHFGKWTNNESDGLLTLTVFQIESSSDEDYIWIGTIAGISRFSIDSETFEHFELPIPGKIKAGVIKRILVDDNSNVWVISGRYLYRFSDQTNEFILIATLNDTTSTFTDIVIDTNNDIWISSTSGLYQFDTNNNKLQLYGFNDTNITVMKLTEENNLLLGTALHGVCVFSYTEKKKDTNFHCLTEKNGLSNNVIISLLLQPNGNIWVATENGLNIINGKNHDQIWKINANQTNLAEDRIASLYRTDEGLIVAGTRDAGFSIYNPNLASFSTKPVGTTTSITGLSHGLDSTIWITGNDSLWQYDYLSSNLKGPYRLTTLTNDTPSLNKLLSVHYDEKSDDVWVATLAGLGLFIPETGKIEVVGLAGKAGYSINTDNQGDVWYGGYSDGVFVYRPSEKTIIRQWPIPLTTRIVFQDDENAWLASVSGLYFANKRTGALTNIGSSHDELPNNAVVTWMSPSSQGGYWIATQANGIYFLTIEGNDLSSVIIKKINADSHLNNISIGSIVEDNNNGVWISNTEGLAYFNAKDTNVSYFGEQNGVSGKGYYIGSALKTGDGTIMMGSPMGLTQFNPDNIKPKPWTPKVHITAIEVVSQTSHWAENGSYYTNIDELLLTPDDISFSVEFAALDYTNPSEVRYAYKLSNFDVTWRYTDFRRRIATYTNLDAGRYTLTVRAINKEGNWSPDEANLIISVTPPWWEKSVWRVAIIFSVILLISLIVWWRISALKRRSEILSAMVEEKTRDLEDAVEKLTRLSSQDPLTGLKNRRYFTQRIQESWERYKRYSQTFSLILIDIDWFKQYNDTYGHHVGDLILVQLSKLLNENLRNTDVIARWGGEEFLILLPELNLYECYKVAEKLRTTVASTTFHCDGNELTVTITAGVTDIRECSNVENCIQTVDQKLYEGKAKGRNIVIK